MQCQLSLHITAVPCRLQSACDACHITLNKNAVVGDVSAMNPGGVRIGTPAMTSRGLTEKDMEVIADFLHEVATVSATWLKCMQSVGLHVSLLVRSVPVNVLVFAPVPDWCAAYSMKPPWEAAADVLCAAVKGCILGRWLLLLLHVQVSKDIQEGSGKMLKDFEKALEGHPKIADIRSRVEAFASAFPMPGFDI
jgi:glycine/serine hydroxymethyltransferase